MRIGMPATPPPRRPEHVISTPNPTVSLPKALPLWPDAADCLEADRHGKPLLGIRWHPPVPTLEAPCLPAPPFFQLFRVSSGLPKAGRNSPIRRGIAIPQAHRTVHNNPIRAAEPIHTRPGAQRSRNPSHSSKGPALAFDSAPLADPRTGEQKAGVHPTRNRILLRPLPPTIEQASDLALFRPGYTNAQTPISACVLVSL